MSSSSSESSSPIRGRSGVVSCCCVPFSSDEDPEAEPLVSWKGLSSSSLRSERPAFRVGAAVDVLFEYVCRAMRIGSMAEVGREVGEESVLGDRILADIIKGASGRAQGYVREGLIKLIDRLS
jgi:hypothetical protein